MSSPRGGDSENGREAAADLSYLTNAPWTSTGYGNQCGIFAPRLAKDYEFAVSAFFGLEGARLKVGDYWVLPGVQNQYGNETIEAHCKAWFDDDLRAGAVLTLIDVWVFDPDIWKGLNVISWTPVDHDP